MHHLKTWPHLFAAIAESDPLLRKTVEIRKDDRNFQVGDILVLEEYDVVNGYTGRSIQRMVTHCLREEPWVPHGFVALSICEMPFPRVEDRKTISSCSVGGRIKPGQDQPL
ncbi:MAG: RNA-binding protein [Sulfobacillus benefaciens]|uniref:RNA-binding protein n=1 Tax=Sulfobacillus benefaciens TaxID=453960 RepID=A0A2T2WWU4_9FIRM|nr:MAG: RNA-binding protein [Sulfobacillus benefaciens]